MYGVLEACSRPRHTVLECFFLSLILLVWYVWQPVCAMSLSADGVALFSIKTSIQTDPLGLLSDWKDGVDPCTWRGVACDATGRVISLNITGKGFNTMGSAPTRSCSSIRSCPNSSACSGLPCQTGYCASRQNWALNTSPMYTHPSPMLMGILSAAVGNLSELRVLSLPYNGFFGEIPKEISALKFLELLDLQGNKFSGPLPIGLGQLSELNTLNVAYNSLQGIIPQEIAGCRKLKVLNVAGNKLSGGIPTFFDRMPGLQVVAMGCNAFSGTIPLELTSSCGSLEHVHLEENQLSGSIPTGFARCLHLQSLVVSSNALSGQIPADIGQLQELEVLDVSRNSLGDDIPLQLANCSRLSVLVLTNSNDLLPCQEMSSMAALEDESSSYLVGEYNYFSSIPTALMGLRNLKLLWAPGAVLGGTLSSTWDSCQSLEVLNLASNSLTGSIPEGLGVQCKRLIYLDLSNNKLEGSLPSTLSVHCMVLFNVSANLLTGMLPDRLSSMCAKSVLVESLFVRVPGPLLMPDNVGFAMGTLFSYFSSLYCGAVSSKLPAWFSRQSMAVVHDMSENNFTGPLRGVVLGEALLERAPAYGFYVSGNKLTGAFSSSLFDACAKLGAFSLKVSRNKLSGGLPADAMSKCMSLEQFEAAANGLVGMIPKGLGALKHLVYLDLSFNRLSGKLPHNVAQLRALQYLMLAGNNLTGTIPESFGKLSSLLVLDLAGNTLTGSIPRDLANLMKLNKILLNNNNLSGFIPTDFSRLRCLSVMDVAYNNLSGSVPHLGSLGTMCTNVNTEGNELLKSCSLSTPAPSNQTYPEPLPSYTNHMLKKAHHPNSIIIAAITSGCAVAAVLIILILLFHCTRQDRHVQVFHRAERKHIVMFRSFEVPLTYENVVAATGNFSVNNLIGTGGFGSTYKAEVIPGVLVAVKRLSLGRFQGTQQFEAEVRTLGRVQHSNLVTLIGYHASASEMFLIYNHLPGGNLEKLLHDSRRGFVCWRIRHKIALNIAQALAYLHDECTPRVLHRDIKPSNVLLDNDLNAFLSDFGLARLLSASETHATTDVAGTFGYVAPEYAMTCRLSEKADVYSYGVVLLELLSGKKALDPYFSKYGNGFNIVAWAGLFYKKGKPAEILAPGLWEAGPHSELMEVLKLAVRCTVVSLSVRPTMREVVEALKAVR